MAELDTPLHARSGGRCELCGATDALSAYVVPPAAPGPDRAVLTCGTCREQLDGAPLDAPHWYCLREASWSEVAAVQVVSWRLLGRMSEHAWARDLLDGVFLDDAVLAWAQDAGEAGGEAAVRTLDSNGAELCEGDAVTLVKDLEVKGAGFTAKRGTVVKNIHLTDDPGLVEGRVNGMVIVLKTGFLKKA